MAIFKVCTSTNGSPAGHTSPEKLEKELKFKKDKKGEYVTRTKLVSALNAYPHSFSLDCKGFALRFNTCHEGSLQYKHYMQCFPKQDCYIITAEKCHDIGIEFAKKFWSDFPVLIVTHYENERYNNHFLVYNCNVHNGRKLKNSRAELWEQKRFVATQMETYGLTLEGLVFDDVQTSTTSKKISRIKREVPDVGKVTKDSQITKAINKHVSEDYLQKIRTRIDIALVNTKNYEEFCEYLKNERVRMMEKNGETFYAFSFFTEWVSGSDLGEKYLNIKFV